MSLQAQEQAQIRKAQIYDLREYRHIKDVLEANIRSFVKHGDNRRRQAMHAVLNAVMSNRKIKRISFPSFDVLRLDDGYIHFRAKKHASGDTCPGCGQRLRYRDMTLIQVQEEGYCHDLVAWGCRRCGEVFSRVEYTGGDLDA